MTIQDAFNDFIYSRMVLADKSGDETNYLSGKNHVETYFLKILAPKE